MYNLADFIGIPFSNGGRDFKSCDCWGLVSLAYKFLYDTIVPNYKISCFSTVEISDEIENATKNVWQKIDNPENPCLITMAIDSDLPGFCNHLGVYIGEGKFLHTVKKQNSVLERINHPFYSKKIKGFLKYVG